MTHSRPASGHLSKALLAVFGLTIAFLAGDAATSPSSAQKAQFERTKPHVSVHTTEQAGDTKTSGHRSERQ